MRSFIVSVETISGMKTNQFDHSVDSTRCNRINVDANFWNSASEWCKHLTRLDCVLWRDLILMNIMGALCSCYNSLTWLSKFWSNQFVDWSQLISQWSNDWWPSNWWIGAWIESATFWPFIHNSNLLFRLNKLDVCNNLNSFDCFLLVVTFLINDQQG